MFFMMLVKQDFLLIFRRKSDILYPLFFYFLVLILFPLGISADSQLLKEIGAGVIWIVSLLATLITLNELFSRDFHDGTMEQFVISGYSLEIFLTTKILTRWLTTALPLVLASPFVGIVFNMPLNAIFVLFISLILGTPIFYFIGAIGSSLTVGLKRGGLLLPSIVMPLYIPTIVFGSSAVHAAVYDSSYNGQLAILGAMLILSVTIAPFAIAASIRTSME
jgi:heme exporter protein B